MRERERYFLCCRDHTHLFQTILPYIDRVGLFIISTIEPNVLFIT